MDPPKLRGVWGAADRLGFTPPALILVAVGRVSAVCQERHGVTPAFPQPLGNPGNQQELSRPPRSCSYVLAAGSGGILRAGHSAEVYL